MINNILALQANEPGMGRGRGETDSGRGTGALGKSDFLITGGAV